MNNPQIIETIRALMDTGFNTGSDGRLLGYYFDEPGLVACVNPETLRVLCEAFNEVRAMQRS